MKSFNEIINYYVDDKYNIYETLGHKEKVLFLGKHPRFSEFAVFVAFGYTQIYDNSVLHQVKYKLLKRFDNLLNSLCYLLSNYESNIIRINKIENNNKYKIRAIPEDGTPYLELHNPINNKENGIIIADKIYTSCSRELIEKGEIIKKGLSLKDAIKYMKTTQKET